MRAKQVSFESMRAKRKAISVDPEKLVTYRTFGESQILPLVIEPALRDLSAVQWIKENRDSVEALLDVHGAILFRGFKLSTPTQFEEFVKATGGNPMPYTERSSPRHEVGNGIYTSTDYPPTHSIFPHNEHSYRKTFPLRIFFFCEIAAAEGGETPIVDVRRVLARISPAVRQKFMEKGWLYSRTFGDRFGLTWQNAFQTDDPAVVESYCRRNKIEWEWRPGGFLSTRQVRPAFAKHPRTGETLWFNHATFFHVSTLPEDVRKVLVAKFDERDLPNNTYYGDGSPIEPEVLEELRSAYEQESKRFLWQAGDLLMVDNMLTAHARAPFSGPRRVLVAMTTPITREDI